MKGKISGLDNTASQTGLEVKIKAKTRMVRTNKTNNNKISRPRKR
jgi:hypothetical protein